MSTTVRKTLDQIEAHGAGKTDWKRVDAFSEEEIERMAAEDDAETSASTTNEVRVSADGRSVILRGYFTADELRRFAQQIEDVAYQLESKNRVFVDTGRSHKQTTTSKARSKKSA